MEVTSKGLRARALRLLNDDVRLDDISRLLLWARERAEGRESVKEIGDYVAHRTERDKGPITRRARGFLGVLHFAIRAHDKPFTMQTLPADIKDFLKLSLEWMPRELLYKETGLSRSQARQMLPAVLGKLAENSDGTFRIGLLLNPQEALLAGCLSTKISPRAAFTGDQLANDFLSILLKWDVLRDAEKKAFQKARAVIQLYAASAMHNSTVLLDGTQRASLHVGDLNGKLVVALMGPPFGDKQIRFSTPIFTTELAIAEHAEIGLLAATAEAAHEIEVTPSGKLGVLA